MDIFLIQHAQAKSSEEDPARPLSKEGEANIRRVSEYADKLGVKIDCIYHSGKERSKQTAEILAEYGVTDKVEAKSGLNPGDEVIPIKDWMERLASEGIPSIAIVGHLPFLDRLASLLVAVVEDAHVVEFQNSGIVKLIPKSSGIGYSIQWILTPDLA
jgi:phosphohistidine phosphatase